MAENVMAGGDAGIADNDYDPDYLKEVIKSDAKAKAQFLAIVGGEPATISERQVHEPAKLRANGDLGIFHRYFFTKYVSMRLKETARSDVLDEHASIFPFRTKPADAVDVVEMPALDDRFGAEIREFVAKHLGDECDAEALKNLFWTNVKDFQKHHFPEPPSVDRLARLVEVGSPTRTSDSREAFPECEYLRNCVRLARGGTLWYQHFQTKFNAACKAYGKEELVLPEKLGYYFRFLPDINCCELLLLLETSFYETDRQKYVHLFTKYLFFFKNAVGRAEHPVCFVDETLFACLLLKRDYETYQEERTIYEYVWPLCAMTLVHCRRYRPELKQPLSLRPERADLEKVVAYADQLLEGVDSVSVYYREPQCRRFTLFLLLDDAAFLLSYSGRKGVGANDWVGQVLKSALLGRQIKKLKFYNAYSGEESVLEMPPQKEEICQFIRQLTDSERSANRLEPDFPLKFLIQPYFRKYFSQLPPIPAHS